MRQTPSASCRRSCCSAAPATLALATARLWARSGDLPSCWPPARPRRDGAVADLEAAGAVVEAVDFEAEALDGHAALVAVERDIDARWSFGVLGDEEEARQDHGPRSHPPRSTTPRPSSVGVCLPSALRRQATAWWSRSRRSRGAGPSVELRHGPPRPAWTASTSGLGEALGHRGPVLVVRPGFVLPR